MYYKKIIGTKGEDISANYLIKNGYNLIERNYRSKFGEIDVIALNDNEIIFIEVKTRTNLKYGIPIEAINYKKKRSILKTAKEYIYKNKYQNINIRFDVIEIYLLNNRYKINHVKNVF